MKKATRLYEIIKEGLAAKSLSSVEILRQSKIEESLVSLTEKFSIRDAVVKSRGDPSESEEINSSAFFNHRNEKSRKILMEQQRQFQSTVTIDSGVDDCGGSGGGEASREGDGDKDGGNGSSNNLAATGDEKVSEVEASSSKQMLLSLASVFGSRDNEPKLTNWNGDFKGLVT